MQSILYVSYDGMLEPLGQSQVLAYLERLAPGRSIHLLSFEKPEDWADLARREALAQRIEAAKIRWHPLRYHKRPSAPATAFDIAVGSLQAVRIARSHSIDVIHARSYVAGLMALAAKRVTGAKFLFDMRGFWADERVDGGLWPKGGRLYRAAKRLERTLLRAADHVVTLTNASKVELGRFPYLAGRLPPITVIPTCADLDRFAIQGPPQRDPFVLGYLGAAGTWYLFDEALRLFRCVRADRPDARLLIVNRGEHEFIRARLAAMAIPDEWFDLRSAEPAEVPALIGAMSAGLAIIKPAYSKMASAATKLAELLGCGVPCIGTDVGDMGSQLEENRVGVVVRDFSEAGLRQAARDLLALSDEQGLQQRCRAVASRLFALDQGVQSYAAIYETLGDGHPQRQRQSA